MDYIDREASLEAEDDEEEFDPVAGESRSNPTNGSGQRNARDFEDSSEEEDDDDDEEAARVCDLSHSILDPTLYPPPPFPPC